MTIQREPIRARAIAEELLRRISAEEAGEVDTMLDGTSLAAEVTWLVRNMDVTRADLIQTAAAMIEDIALWDMSHHDNDA
jgi:hypothetical protein